jgi:hypothetical protein
MRHTPTKGRGDSAARYRYIKSLEEIRAIEGALLDALDGLCPSDDVPNSVALPFLNRLEARGEAITEAVDLIREEIESLLSE